MMNQAQAKIKSLSSNVKWGFRKRFQDGTVYYHYDSFLGYRRGEDGQLEIDEEQAAVVRHIFSHYLMGQSVGQICRDLMADGIKTARGGDKWCDSTVHNMLQNEKYIDDAILQKAFAADLFNRQQVKNEGQLPKYYVHDAHSAIIDRVTFRRVHEEMARRSSLRRTSSKAKTELDKYCGKYVFSELRVCSECDEELQRVATAKTELLPKKPELEHEGCTSGKFDRRMAEIDHALKREGGAIEAFDEALVRQLASNIKVLDKDRILVRFKDGTEVEQAVEDGRKKISAYS